jgi:hypothetical protein
MVTSIAIPNAGNTRCATGAGGGGGSSYTDASVLAVTTGLAGNDGNLADTRRPGSIALAY